LSEASYIRSELLAALQPFAEVGCRVSVACQWTFGTDLIIWISIDGAVLSDWLVVDVGGQNCHDALRQILSRHQSDLLVLYRLTAAKNQQSFAQWFQSRSSSANLHIV
jgi:hypothetical protein